VIKTVVDCNDGRLPLVLGVGGNDTRKVEELQTRDFLLLLQCFSILQQTYSRRNQHFKVSQASPIPIIIYNVPEELQVICCENSAFGK
jgi:4-hydroxy-tetrahydrodipicolinate synthase